MMLARLRPLAALAFAALSLALAACGGDDFSESTTPELRLTIGDDGTGAQGLYFGPLPVGTIAERDNFILENVSSEVALNVESVTFFTDSAELSMSIGLETGRHDFVPGEPFGPFEVDSQGQYQFDVAYDPVTANPGCSGARPAASELPTGCVFPTEASSPEFCGYAQILTDDTSDPCVLIPFFVRVSGGELSVSPAEISFRAASEVDEPQTAEITVSNVGSNNLRLEQVDIGELMPTSAFSIDGERNPPTTLTPGSSLAYTLTYDPSGGGEEPAGPAGRVRFVSDAGQGGTKTIEVFIGDFDAPVAEIAPESGALQFGNVAVGGSETQQVTITNAGGPLAGALVVSNVGVRDNLVDFAVSDDVGFIAGAPCEGANPPTSCNRSQLVIARGSSLDFDVTFTPTTESPGPGVLRFTTNDPDHAEVLIALRTIGGAGALVADPSSISFDGPATEGEAATPQMITLTNPSSGTVEVTGAALEEVAAGNESCQHFSVTFTPSSIAPDATATAEVGFTRPADDPIGIEHACNLVFANDGASPVTVSLRVNYP